MNELRYNPGFIEMPVDAPGIVQELDGTVWVVMPNGARLQIGGGPNVFSRHGILFTETSGSGAYTGSVTVPPGTSILDVAVFCLAGPWQAATAELIVGDEFHDDGYIIGINLVTALNSPYDNTNPRHGTDWSDPNINGGVYGNAANWYAAGNAVYTPTVRYPDGATITATITAVEGGPIASTNTDDPGSPGEGYAPGDHGTIVQTSNSSATYRVNTVDGGGGVTSYTITDPGTAYMPDEGLSTTTSGSGEFFALNITEVDVAPVTDPGIVVVDVIGFGVPSGKQDAVKS